MTTSLLADAFGHHRWATLRILDAVAALSPDQLQTTVPGTYGSILDTARHLIGADVAYLALLSGERVARIDEADMDVAALRAAFVAAAPVWDDVLAAAQDRDPAETVVRRHPDGSEYRAPLGVRLAQVVHHGTDHRSQIATALTTLGITPPELDVWDWAETDGRLSESGPTGA